MYNKDNNDDGYLQERRRQLELQAMSVEQQQNLRIYNSSHGQVSEGKEQQQVWVEQYQQQQQQQHQHQHQQNNLPTQTIHQQQLQQLGQHILPHQLFPLREASDVSQHENRRSELHAQSLQHGTQLMYTDERSELMNLLMQQQQLQLGQLSVNHQQVPFHLLHQNPDQQIQQGNTMLHSQAWQTHLTSVSRPVVQSQGMNSMQEGLNLSIPNFSNFDDQRDDQRSNFLNSSMHLSDLQQSVNTVSTLDGSLCDVKLSRQRQSQGQQQFEQQQSSLSTLSNLNSAGSSETGLKRNISQGSTSTSNRTAISAQDVEPTRTSTSLEDRVFSIFTGTRKRCGSEQLSAEQQPLRQQRRAPLTNRIPPSRAASSQTVSADSSSSIGEESLLHISCKLYPGTRSVVESALEFDPEAVRRSVPLMCTGRKSSSSIFSSGTNVHNQGASKEGGSDSSVPRVSAHNRVDCMDDSFSSTGGNSRLSQQSHDNTGEKYAYPINIALKCGAGLDVIELLAKAGPDVLIHPDGPDSANSLGIALTLGYDQAAISKILSVNPQSAMFADRYENTPLHIAMRVPTASVDIVSLIYEAYPDALSYRNFNNNTPLELAIRSPLCSEDVVNYLQEVTCSQQEMHNTADLDRFEAPHH